MKKINPKTILLLGASGFVGQAIFQHFSQQKEYQLIGTYYTHLPETNTKPDSRIRNINVLEDKKLKLFLEETKPDIIINTIAIPNIDLCEENHQTCDLININPTKTITAYCHNHPKTKYIFFSSDHIFDGTKKSQYTEIDPPSPANYYGQTKLACEQQIITTCSNYVILRPCFIFGPTQPHNHQNLLTTIYSTILQKKTFHAYTDKIRSPCYIQDIPKIIKQLIKKDKRGIFNLGGETLSVYEFAQKIAAHYQLDQKKIIGITSTNQEKVPRPQNCSLDHTKTEKELDITFTPISDALNKIRL